VGSFAGIGVITGLSGTMAVRGAEVGSALVARILSYDLTILIPLCLLAGTTIFMTTVQRPWRQAGRIFIGVGLLILSLQMMAQAAEPLRDSRIVPLIVNYLSGDPLTAFVLAGLVTYLFQSSIAAVLLLATFAARGMLSPELGIVMVLGVNLGSSFIAPVLTRAAPPDYRTVPLGNLLMRGVGSIFVLVAYLVFAPPIALLGKGAADQVINAHILFNVFVLLFGIPLSRPVLKATRAIVASSGDTSRPDDNQPVEFSALDPAALDSPQHALANVTREAVRMCETIDFMLCRVLELYESADKQTISSFAALDDTVDKRHRAIKLYLASIDRKSMSEKEARRCQELLGVCVKLEQVADIIVRNLLAHVHRKMKRKVDFTTEGWQELSSFHAAVLANARLSFNLVVSRDPATARQIVTEKDRLREIEKVMSRHHFERLRKGTEKSVDTSSIHLDTIRDLKQINSLLATLAYPILEDQGMLSGSRLKTNLE
jgi:phosphate:Na+ symporter